MTLPAESVLDWPRLLFLAACRRPHLDEITLRLDCSRTLVGDFRRLGELLQVSDLLHGMQLASTSMPSVNASSCLPSSVGHSAALAAPSLLAAFASKSDTGQASLLANGRLTSLSPNASRICQNSTTGQDLHRSSPAGICTLIEVVAAGVSAGLDECSDCGSCHRDLSALWLQ